MKIWKIPVRELDDKRVIVQHNELHTIWGMIQKGQRFRGWEQAKYRTELLTLHQAAAVELHLRGMRHDSAIDPWAVPRGVKQELHDWSEDELWNDRWALVCRWRGKYEGRGDQPPIYDTLIDRYQRQGRCLHDLDITVDGRCSLCLEVVGGR